MCTHTHHSRFLIFDKLTRHLPCTTSLSSCTSAAFCTKERATTSTPPGTTKAKSRSARSYRTEWDRTEQYTTEQRGGKGTWGEKEGKQREKRKEMCTWRWWMQQVSTAVLEEQVMRDMRYLQSGQARHRHQARCMRDMRRQPQHQEEAAG